jgi:hypothetical protein
VKQAKDQRDVLARIGAILIQIQRTELTINFCIKHVMPKTARPAKDMFAPDGRRPPLGRLIAELHRHVTVADTFKATLAEYLNARNAFVHQIEFVPGWTLHTDEGRSVALAFLNRFDALDREVSQAFAAMLRAWQIANGAAPRKKGTRLFPMSNRAYQHLARSLRLP